MLPYFSLHLSDRTASGGDALKERWLKGHKYAFPHPNTIQLVLGRLIRWAEDLIMIITFGQIRAGSEPDIMLSRYFGNLSGSYRMQPPRKQFQS